MEWDETLTRGQLVQAAGRAALAGSLLGGFDALARTGEALAAGSPADVRRFVSRPDLRPPRLTVLHNGNTAHGHIFLAPSSGPGQRGLMIADSSGELVYWHPTTPLTAMNFRAGTYRGKPVLTWWEGKALRGLGTGTHVILDDTYRVVARVPAGHGRQSDLHEFLLTPEDTALVTSYEVRDMDLSPVGGPAAGGRVIGGIVQELELPSGRVLFEWNSLDHVDITETHVRWEGHPLDYFHVNSIDLASDGGLLVSARNTWAVYKVSRKTGEVRWRLGGKRSDFKMGKGTVFAWQHDARHQGHNRISIFDDGAQPQVEPQSRALLIQLDPKTQSARLVRKYVHRPGRIVTRFMGNMQTLENGNVMVGWGSEPYLTEFAPDGSIEFDAKLPKGGQNYRAFRFAWHGRPFFPPAAVERGGKVYVSWNGATDVAAWRLESGPRVGALTAGAAVARRGFETALTVPSGHAVGRVVAIDAAGHELGRSKTIKV